MGVPTARAFNIKVSKLRHQARKPPIILLHAHSYGACKVETPLTTLAPTWSENVTPLNPSHPSPRPLTPPL